ncbi:MAG: hypothetical protein GY705_08010 [Bacteroidetes bacterium]|nr:hypothetical protein [Bacteroidota bacterium]
MNQRSFFTQLLILTAFVIILIFVFQQIKSLAAYQVLSWISIVFFFLLSGSMYFAGKKAALSTNKYQFSNVVLGFTTGKLFISVIIVLGYNYFFEPTSKLFLIPFFSIYLIYTIFETYFMMKLSKKT